MADRWYLKGIHVPVNRFGSEENKKRESPTNRTARVSNRHSFHRQVKNQRWKPQRTPLFL